MSKTTYKGTSLAKGPVAIVGMILLIFGVTALIFGGHSFTANPVSGTVNGENWLGIEVNAWTSLLFVGAGGLLLLGAPVHWGAKTMSLIVGLGLGVAAVIALIDGEDVLGIFAANGLTKLVWAVAAAVLLILALLPRVGGDRRRDREPDYRHQPLAASRTRRDNEPGTLDDNRSELDEPARYAWETSVEKPGARR
jgi:hypothetical protein